MLIVLAAAWASIAQAAPLDLKEVGANALWVAHIDLDAARESKVVKAFYHECVEQCSEAKEHLEMACHKLGVKECKDIHGLTAYGTKYEPHTGALLVQAKLDKDIAMKELQEAPEQVTWEYGKHEVHTWLAHRGTRWAHLACATFYKPDLVVIGSGPAELKAALDVLDGKASNLSGKDSPLAAEAPKYAIFQFRAVEVNKSHHAKHCPIIEQIRRVNYCEGQQGDRWIGHFDVLADSSAAAKDLKQIVHGFKAAVSLYCHGHAEIVNMLGNVKVVVDNETVKVTFEESADKLVQQTPEFCKLIHQRHKQHMEWWKHEKD